MRNDYVVYIHKNILNGKVYVGQTCNLSERWRNNGKNYFNSIKFYNAIMYHTEGGRKYSGEKFDIHKAKEICERYRGVIPVSATPTDVYVAINSQYHDYVELFKSWFGDNVDQKIIESAIIFWFKDVDCKAENKVVEYLGEY